MLSLFGVVSLAGVCVLLAVAASKMISVDDPNAPVALVYVDPIVPEDAAIDESTVARQIGEVTEVGEDTDQSPAVKVLGVTLSDARPHDEQRILAVDPLIGGDELVGDWVIDEEPATRYLIVERDERVRLLIITGDAKVIERPLVEMPVASGRRFANVHTPADGEYFVVGHDGGLSIGTTDGIGTTVDGR